MATLFNYTKSCYIIVFPKYSIYTALMLMYDHLIFCPQRHMTPDVQNPPVCAHEVGGNFQFFQRTLLGEKYFVGGNFHKLRQILHL
jgi:hypothetical protein